MLVPVPQFPQAQAEEKGEGSWKDYDPQKLPRGALAAVNQSNVGSPPACSPPPATALLPAPAPSPPAPGPARYNYSPLIRPGPGKRLPRGGQASGFRHRQPLPTAPVQAELLGHQPGLSPTVGQGSRVTSDLGSSPWLALNLHSGKTTHTFPSTQEPGEPAPGF